jgi:hypothetical protein
MIQIKKWVNPVNLGNEIGVAVAERPNNPSGHPTKAKEAPPRAAVPRNSGWLSRETSL